MGQIGMRPVISTVAAGGRVTGRFAVGHVRERRQHVWSMAIGRPGVSVAILCVDRIKPEVVLILLLCAAGQIASEVRRVPVLLLMPPSRDRYQKYHRWELKPVRR